MQNSVVKLDSPKLLRRLGKHLLCLIMLFKTKKKTPLKYFPVSFVKETEK